MRLRYSLFLALAAMLLAPVASAQAGLGDPLNGIVINEVDADQTDTDAAEFVELYNSTGSAIDLAPGVLVFFNGSDDASYNAVDLDGFTIPAGGYFVYCGDAANVPNCDLEVLAGTTNLIQNGADAVALIIGEAASFPEDTPATMTNLVDALVYGTADGDDAELLAALGQTTQYDEDATGNKDTESNQRSPDGAATVLTAEPTPGAANAGGGGGGDPSALVINEIQYDPASDITGDANGDGTSHFGEDEFVEIFNTGADAVDISGFTLSDDDDPPFAFPDGTVLAAGQAAVLFGGGTPAGDFGGALVFTDDGSIGSGLSNSGDLVQLKDASGTVVTEVGYGSAGDVGSASDQALARNPDFTGAFVEHSTIAGNPVLFSPGTLNAGSGGGGDPSDIVINEIQYDPASDITGDANGDGTSHFGEDEFVEIFNTGADAVDISGFTLSDDDDPPFAFPDGTVLAAGQAAVLFGGGTPAGDFGGALVFTDDGSIGSGLSNSGDLVQLKDASGTVVTEVGYGSAGDAGSASDQALARNPDFTGAFVEHSAIATNPILFSPGRLNAESVAPPSETFNAYLLGASEVGPVETPAAGYVTAVLTGTELEITGRFAGLTGDYAASHIHEAPAGTNGGVVQALSPTVGADSRSGSFDETLTLTAENAQALRDGNFYVNVHSAAVGSGEIRGQLVMAPAIPQVTLAQARNLGDGIDVSISGTVSRAAGAFTYLQDETGGLVIRQTSGTFFDEVAAGTIDDGTSLDVTGRLSSFNGLLQINTSALASYANNGAAAVPTAQEVTIAEILDNGEAYESELITVRGLTFADAGGTFAAGTNYEISDATATGALRIVGANDTEVEDTAIPGGNANVTGVLGQFTFDIPAVEGYQLQPINAADVQVATANEEGVLRTGAMLAVENPARGSVSVRFDAGASGRATLTVFDMVGRQVAVLAAGDVPAGERTATLDAGALASGVYVIRLDVESGTLTRVVTVVR